MGREHTIVEWKRCRVCEATDLTLFLELPNIPLVDDLLHAEEFGNEFVGPLRLYLCNGCGLVQTLRDINIASYYRDYRYSVASSPFALHFMQQLADLVWDTYGFQAGDRVIEVGSSDGMQLAGFHRKGAQVLGFEPSLALAQSARRRGIEVVQELFDVSSVEKISADKLPTQVLVLTHTLDHLPDPNGFLEAAKRALDPARGVLVIEVHDLEKTVARRESCLFAHEHTTYYCAASLQRVLLRAGFHVINTALVPDAERRINSLLVVATLSTSIYASQKMSALAWNGLDRADYMLAFGRSVHSSLTGLREFVQGESQRGVRLAGYGVGARGIMTLAAIARPGDFAYVCDKNPNVNGYFTPGTHIPVFTPEHLLTDPVDKVIVFSFGYFQEIYEELDEFRQRGGSLISLLDLL